LLDQNAKIDRQLTCMQVDVTHQGPLWREPVTERVPSLFTTDATAPNAAFRAPGGTSPPIFQQCASKPPGAG
jgi:hypothetical protein